MKRLTPGQLQAIQEIEQYPFIHSVSIEFIDGISSVCISSAINADLNQVDQAIADELDELFPELESRGLPTKYVDSADGFQCELYYIWYCEETLIRLTMRSKAEQTLEDKMNICSDLVCHSCEEGKCQTPEQILRNEA